MKKILVPTDFSDNANKALDYAVAMASKANAEIILLNTFAAAETTLSPARALVEEYNRTIEADANDQLKALKEGVEAKYRVEIAVKLMTGGAKEAILSVAAEENVDLIVMGTRGTSGMERILWGSTTASVIGNSSVPVLAIPRGAGWKGIKNILFATRAFQANDKMFGPILQLAELEGATVHLVIFTDTDDKDLVNYLEHSRLFYAYQDTLPARFKNLTFKIEHLEGKAFYETINQYVEEQSIDLMVMSTHKRNFWQSIFNRSMTKKMTTYSDIPLLALPAEAEE